MKFTFKTGITIYMVGYFITLLVMSVDYMKYSEERWKGIAPNPTSAMAMGVLPASFWPVTMPVLTILKITSGNKYLSGGIK